MKKCYICNIMKSPVSFVTHSRHIPCAGRWRTEYPVLFSRFELFGDRQDAKHKRVINGEGR